MVDKTGGTAAEELPQTQTGRLQYLVRYLVKESGKREALDTDLPDDIEKLFELFRYMVNIRPPAPVSHEFLAVQDAFFEELLYLRGMTDIDALFPVRDTLYLWWGDITSLRVDAIVNDASPALTGCFTPLHTCVDNNVHTFAGVQLRLECSSIINRQGHAEPTGAVKVTSGYNLPARYIMHTVVPSSERTWHSTERMKRYEAELASCYECCLEAAYERGLDSIAFCPLGTGAGVLSSDVCARVAVETTEQVLTKHDKPLRVVFCITDEKDNAIYRAQLTGKKA